MPSPGDMFRSYGSIRVLLVEADEGSKKSRSDNVDAKFFVTVSLVDKESSTLAHSLLISLTIIGDRSAGNCQRTTIPVSRLEEDTEIFQWYQMYTSSSPITNKGEVETPLPGSAIKLQIVYMKVELPNLSDNELLDIISEDLIPESADPDTVQPATLPTDTIPVVPESIPEVPESIPEVPESIPVVPESIPEVPESIPVVPESIPTRPKVNMMVPLPRKRSISSIPKFQESIPKSQESVPLTWKSAPLIPDPVPKVPDPVPKVADPVPKLPDPVPKVPASIPLTPEPITTRPKSNAMVPLPRKRSIKINTDPVPLEDDKKDVASPMPEKILVGILKSPTSKTSQVSMGSSRKEDIRTTFSKDVEVNCFEEHVSDGDSAEKRSSLKKQEPSRNFSFNLDEEALVEEKEGEERLTVGLIDYALLIGPLDDGYGGTGTGTGTGQGTNPQCDKSSRKIHVQYSLRPESDIPFTGYGSSMGQDEQEMSMSMSPTSRNSVGRNSAPMESDMCIWDRFPLDDHEESPLADKIEYFACPDGSKEVRSATRPEPRFSTFILSGSGESDGQFGICMTVFIKSYNNLYMDVQSISRLSRGQSNSKGDPLPEGPDHPHPPTEPAVRVPTNWWQNGEVAGGGVSDHSMEGDSSLPWTAVTVCFLSRWPHVQQLQRCLLYLYRSCILTSLERWEERCEVLIAAYKDKEQATPRSCPDGGYEDDRGEGGYLVLEPVRLPLKCVELLTMLCLESPVPLWGVFTLDIVLPGTLATSRTLSFQTAKDKDKDSTLTPPPSEKEKEKVAMVPIPVKKKLVDTVIEFAHIPPDDLPLCPYSICNSIFHCLGARGVLTVLSAALAESRILFFSSDAFLLPAVCESLRVLLYPLKWAHVYLPVVPAPLLDLVQAPVPFILGTLTKWIDLIPSEYLSEVILVDLDTGAIDSMRNRLMVKDTPSADMVLPFPPKIERWLLCSLNEVLMPNQDVSDVTSQDTQLGRVQAKDTMVQLLVFDVMANLLRYVPGCIFSLNIGDHEGPSHHVFNRPLFLWDCVEEETRPFLTLLTDTNAFEQFTESLYSPSMGFYLRSLNALPTPISSLKPGSSPLRPTGASRRSSRQIDRDVLLLSGDEVVPVVKDDSGSAFSFPDSIINGGDRLNVVKVPVPVLSSAPSSPEGSRRGSNNSSGSSSIRGMLVFPAVSQQVNQPFSAQNACSCDSILSRSTDSSLPKHKAHSEESDIGRLLIMFPDWIAALLALKGLEAAALQGRVPFSRPVIDFYSGFLMCYREQQVLEDTYDCEPSGKDYEGYQLGNTISRKAGPAGAEPFPVLTLVLSSCKVRNIINSFSSDQESSSQVTFSDIEGLDDSFDSYQGHRPRPKSLRSPSQMERERMVEDAKSPVKRTMVPLPARSGSGEARPQSLNLSKAKRLRAQSMRLPGSTPSGITNTGDSSNGLSPSYLSFLPLIGKPAGLNMTDSGRIAETESITSSPAISPHTSLSGALNYGMTPATMSLALQKEDGVIVRSRSYGRIRSSTFSLVSSKKGSASATKQIRRRHSAESTNISPSLSAPLSTPSPVSAPPVSRMPPSMYKMERRNRVQPLSSGSMDSSESRKLTSTLSASSMVSIPSTDSLDPLRDPPRDSLSLRGSNQFQLEVDTTEKSQSSALCLCPPLIFDTAAFENAAGEIDEWTVSELAQALQQPLKSILKTMKGEADLGIDPFSPWPSSNNSPAPSGTAEASKPSNVRSPSRKWPNRVAMGMGGAPVTDYLQFAFSGVSMSPRQIEHLERRCASALEAHDNRMRLVYLLRQTNKGTPAIPANSPAISRQRLELVQPHSQSKDLESQLFPLHSSTFELLSKLYSLAVESCVTHRDYLAAYGLLGVGGLYYQVESRPQRRQSANDISDGIQETEFLSERICQHPIFQSPHLWLAVMRDKLSFSKKGSTGDDDDDDDEEDDEAGGEEKSPVVYDIDALFLESYALLFIINRLGVNFERAAAFNKMVASDFSLAKGQYLQLQQYTEQLYGRRISSGQSPLLLKKGSGEFVVSRSRSKSDSSHVMSEWGKAKDRNSFPASAREGTIVFKNDNSADWGSDAEADSQAPTYTEGLEVVLADLTLLLPTAPPTPHDDYSSSPVSWSQNAIPNFSPVGTTKAKSNPTPFLRSLGRPVPAVLDPMPCQPPRGYGYAPRMRSEAPSGRKQRRNTENLTPDAPSPARRRASAMATKLKSYFTRRNSKTDVARDDGAAEEKQLSAVRVTSTSEPSSPQPLAGAPSQQDLERELETETEREDSPIRCWTDRNKCLQGLELNNRNYYSVPLEGSLVDHSVSVCTTGRYLIAGLRDGGINVNNLTTGSLVLRLSHSADKNTSAASKQSRTPLRPYNGVTHLQCLTPPEPSTAPGRGPSPALGEDSLCAFVSACSGGVVKVWRLAPSTANGQTSGGRWSGRRRGPIEEELTSEDDLVLSDQAVLEVHPGETITCLQADCDSSHQRNKRTDNPGGWVVVSGDRKGLVNISWGDFSLPPSAHDSASEEEGSGKHPNHTLKKRDSHLAGQRLSSQQPRVQQMAVRSVPVTVLVGKGEITCLTLTRKQGRVFGRSQWDLLAVGTSTGRIALVDVLEGKCRYMLEGHSGCVTGVVSLSHLLADDMDQGGHSGSLIASCGSDRRVLLWDTFGSTPVPASDHATKRGVHHVEDERARNGALPTPPVIDGKMLCVSGIAINTESKQRSAAGPLIALCISPTSTSVSRHRQHPDSACDPRGLEHRSFVLAAACADGALLLWDLTLRLPGGDFDKGSGDDSEMEDKLSALGSPHKHLLVGHVCVLRGHSDRVTEIKYRSCGTIETASLDGTMRVWTQIRSPSLSPRLSGTNTPHGMLSPRDAKGPFSSFTCSAVLKLFGTDTDDCQGVAFFSVTTCVASSRSIMGDTRAPNSNLSPPRILFSDSQSEQGEGDRGSETPSSALEGKDDTEGAEETARRPAVPAVWPSAVPWGKSWLVAVSLGGNIKAFITPTLAPSMPRPNPF